MKRIILSIVILLAFIMAGSPTVVMAHEPNLGPFPLAGEYSVEVNVESVGSNSYVFTYVITNLSESSDYSGIGMPEWCNGIDPTGLDGFFLRIPKDATLSNIQVPNSYREGGWWSDVERWAADADYDWIKIWGNGTQSVYPIGVPLTFSFQVDNVAVGTNQANLTTFFYDHAIRYPGPPPNNEWFSVYVAQIISPVTVPPGQPIDYILELFDDAAISGGLVGEGPGTSANGRLKALRNMLKSAEELIDRGLITEAIQQLEDAHKRVDDNPKPPDFASGSEVSALAAMVTNLIDTLRNP
jgi:hypothetical protein